MLERWHNLRGRKATTNRRQEADALASDIEASLTQATGKQVTGRAFALLSQYYVGDLPAEAHAMIFSDWSESLGDQPFWALDNACKRYLAGTGCKKKPLPGLIRTIALDETLELRGIIERIHWIHRQQGEASDSAAASDAVTARVYPQSFLRQPPASQGRANHASQ